MKKWLIAGLGVVFILGLLAAQSLLKPTKVQAAAPTIPVSALSNKPFYMDATIAGTKMSLIAVKAQDGSIRTTLNTCEVCYRSPRGYYKTSGDYIVCQNCGNRFHISQIQVERGGCNPVPLFNSKVDGDKLVFSLDELAGMKKYFPVPRSQ
ncbi:MAG: Fe-S-containing protein [Bacillota bacterium]